MLSFASILLFVQPFLTYPKTYPKPYLKPSII